MKKKIKEFWERHKKGIVIGGLAVVGGTITAIVLKQCSGGHESESEKKASHVWWEETEKRWNGDEVRGLLAYSEKGNTEDFMFAIFHEGDKPNEYTIIDLGKSTVKKF